MFRAPPREKGRFMRRALLATFAVLLPGISVAQFYEYPDRIELDPKCEAAPNAVKAAEAEYSIPDAGESGAAKGTLAPDLNGDGRCEILLQPPRSELGTGGYYTMVFTERDGARVHIGDLPTLPNSWWYGVRKNGYVRIFVLTNMGHRTNPEYTTSVYAFDGTKYVTENRPTATHGYYLDAGLKAYRSRDFALAEKHYKNAYRMNAVPTLADANNLALVWLRQEKFDDAKALLVRHLLDDASTDQLGAAYFNLGIIEERKGNREKAMRHYVQAYEIAPTPAREQKLRELGR